MNIAAPALSICIAASLLANASLGSIASAYPLALQRPATSPLTIIYTFTGGNGGAFPLATPVEDRSGRIIGTTQVSCIENGDSSSA